MASLSRGGGGGVGPFGAPQGGRMPEPRLARPFRGSLPRLPIAHLLGEVQQDRFTPRKPKQPANCRQNQRPRIRAAGDELHWWGRCKQSCYTKCSLRSTKLTCQRPTTLLRRPAKPCCSSVPTFAKPVYRVVADIEASLTKGNRFALSPFCRRTELSVRLANGD